MGAVRLRKNHQLGTTVGIALQNEHRFAAARVKWIVNLPFFQLLAGSLSLF